VLHSHPALPAATTDGRSSTAPCARMALPVTRSLKRFTPCSPRLAIWTTTRFVLWPAPARASEPGLRSGDFYHYFSLKPPGKHTATICAGTACYIKGSDKLVAAAEKRLGLPVDRQRRMARSA